MLARHYITVLIISSLINSCVSSSKSSTSATTLTPSTKTEIPVLAHPSATPLKTANQTTENFENIDRYEHFNRNTYRFNNKIDRVIVKPTIRAYVKIIPYLLRQSISNFFNNIGKTSDTANDILQGNFYWGINDLKYFIINSTAGLGGLFNVAKKIGLTPHNNNFSMTLLTWRAKPTPYVVLPLVGPANLTNVNGIIVDFYLSPWHYGPQGSNINMELFMLRSINLRANLLRNEALINQLAIDRYAFMRNAYLQNQHRQMEINKNPPIGKNFNNNNTTDEIYSKND